MEVPLAPELERFVEEEVKSGRYSSPADLVRRAIEMLRQEAHGGDEVGRLRQELAAGIAELDRGEGTPLDVEAIIAAGRRRASQARGVR